MARLLFAKDTVGSLTSTNQCQQTQRRVYSFIAASGFEPSLDSLEATVRYLLKLKMFLMHKSVFSFQSKLFFIKMRGFLK